jgi:hypothetical protein
MLAGRKDNRLAFAAPSVFTSNAWDDDERGRL